MTIKELYEWATDHNVENFDLEIVLSNNTCKSINEYNLNIDRLYEEVMIDTE